VAGVNEDVDPVAFPLRSPGAQALGWIGIFTLWAITICGSVYIAVWTNEWDVVSQLVFALFGMILFPVFLYRNYVHPRVDCVEDAIVVFTFFGKDIVAVDQVTALLGDRFLVLELIDGSRVALEPIDLSYWPIRPWVGPRVHAQQIELLKSVLNVP
jgi:hypothetical protein